MYLLVRGKNVCVAVATVLVFLAFFPFVAFCVYVQIVFSSCILSNCFGFLCVFFIRRVHCTYSNCAENGEK